MKTTDMMVDSVRMPRNLFRSAERGSKVQQSRYQRRKVREYLRVGDWLGEA